MTATQLTLSECFATKSKFLWDPKVSVVHLRRVGDISLPLKSQ